MAVREFTLVTVKEFMLENGGKVKNHELVTHFKSFLNDPQQKVQMREKFKDFVNTLATIKVDESGDKILVLKKKYRESDGKQDSIRAMSEPPRGDVPDGGMPSKIRNEGRSEGNLPGSESRSSLSVASSTNSISSSVSASSLSSGIAEEDINTSVISVKERAKHLNRIESESEFHPTHVTPLGKKKDSRINRDDGEESTGSAYVVLEPLEKEWLVTASMADYHSIHQLLSKHPSLARVKDFTNTALHWAAKQGQIDVIKMLVGKPGVNVNQKTGYTALHLAAMHGHEDAIELLVQAFKADPNIRDYSGKKAKQYLRNSASTRSQQLLASTRLGSKSNKLSEEQFLRGGSARRSNRARAISSLIQASTGGFRQALRTNWGSSEDVCDGTPNSSPRHTPSPSPRNSAEPSPVTSRRVASSNMDSELMPPPSGATRRQKKKPHSVSKESLTSEDRQLSELKQVPRSESEPNLGDVCNPRSKSMYI